MRGGSHSQAFMGWLICLAIFIGCIYYAYNASSQTGKTTAIVFAVIFGFMAFGMPIEAYGKYKTGTLLPD